MWFPVLSILLSTTPNLQRNEDITLPIKELHYKISKTVSKIVEESKLLPDPSELELAEKTKKLLEEYIEVDISSGLPEQIQLLELKDKADDVKTSEETRKGVMDGLELLGSLGELRMDGVTKLHDTLEDELKKVIDFEKDTGLIAPYSKLRDVIKELRVLVEYYELVKDNARYSPPESSEDKEQQLILAGSVINDAYKAHQKLFRMYDEVEQYDPVPFDSGDIMKNFIGEGKEKCAEIRKLNEEFEFSQKILSVKGEIQVMEELRDSEAIQRILELIEKLEGSFQGMQGSGLERLQWKIDYSLRKMTPIRNHLKTLKIPPGDLTEPVRKVESCLQNYDFSMDFSTEEEEFKEIEETLNEIRAKNKGYLNGLNEMEEFRKAGPIIKKMEKFFAMKHRDWDEFVKLLNDLVRYANRGRMELVPELDTQLSEIRDLFKKLSFDAIRKLSHIISIKIPKVNKFLECHSTLGIVPSEIKSLMDQPEKVWNFDPRSLQYALEVVYLFKDAHRFLVDQKAATANKFPLTREEVSEVSEGFRILEALLNFQKFWAKNSGKFSSTLADQLSHLKDLSKIQFLPDPHLDSIINFYNSTQYQGGQRTQILKTLEAVKDTSEFAVKLEKMNEGIRKYLGPEPQGIEEKELIDCLENTCSASSLPEVFRKNL